MLIQGEMTVDQERNIVLYRHVDRILQGVDLQDFRIGIVFSAYCVVQFQQVILVLEQHDEQGGLIRPVDRQRVVFVSFAIIQPPCKNVVQRD